jgi:hypothetical protein
MDIETRMAALERSVRWWRIGACVAGVALAAVAAVGAQRQPAVPDLVEAHGIRIVDDDGKEAFAVTADPAAGATLTLRVGNRGGMVLIGGSKNGPQIGMRNNRKDMALRVSATDAGGQIVLFDADRQTFAAPPPARN